MEGNSEDKGASAGPMNFPHNPIDGLGNGCLLDLRVRMAVEILKGPLFQGSGLNPDSMATRALLICDQLLKQGLERGWVAPLPADGELPPELRAHAERTSAFQVCQQMAGQKFALAEQSRVVPAAPGVKINS